MVVGAGEGTWEGGVGWLGVPAAFGFGVVPALAVFAFVEEAEAVAVGGAAIIKPFVPSRSWLMFQ